MRIKLNKDSIVGLLAVPALALSVAGVMFQATPAFADPSTEKPPLTVSGGAKSAKGTDQSAWWFSLRHLAGRPDAGAVGQEYYFILDSWYCGGDSSLCGGQLRDFQLRQVRIVPVAFKA